MVAIRNLHLTYGLNAVTTYWNFGLEKAYERSVFEMSVLILQLEIWRH